MSKSIFCVLISFFLIPLNVLHASFLDLVKLYDVGRPQTGVGAISSGNSFGTGTLIDDQTLLTTADVVRDMAPEEVTVRLINNRDYFSNFEVQEMYSSHENNIALIWLKEYMDTERYVPISIDFDFWPLLGQEVLAYGCGASPSERKDHSLRRGHTITIGKDEEDEAYPPNLFSTHDTYRLDGQSIRFACLNPETVIWGNLTRFYKTSDIDGSWHPDLPRNLDFSLLQEKFSLYESLQFKHPREVELNRRYRATFYPNHFAPSVVEFDGDQGGPIIDPISGKIIALNRQPSIFHLQNEEDVIPLSDCKDWINTTLQQISQEV
ncbi:MAG: trypsin-like serine protease [bacterium]|nr:trypsin-like serine protease [bacterium]